MRKLFTILFAVLASVGMMFAESGTCGENLTWDLTNGVLTISGTGDMTNFDDEIPAPWYEHKESISSVVIGNSVTSIGDGAFYGCSNLASVTIPNSIKRIGYMAFCTCTGLTSVTIPNNVSSIGDMAFCGCRSLSSITNHATSPQKIDANVFGGIVYDWGSDASWDVDKSIPLYVPYKSIDVYKAAEGWSEFTNIQTIPGTEPCADWMGGDTAAYYCYGTSYEWHGEEYTAANTPAIHTYTSKVYPYCDSIVTLTLIELPELTGDTSVSVIKGSSFNWHGIRYTAANTPATHTYTSKVYPYCDSIVTLHVVEINLPCEPISGTCGAEGDNLTWELSCDSVLTISGSGAMQRYRYGWSDYKGKIKSIIIHDGVTTIEDWAFNQCTRLQSVIIPNTVTRIGTSTFAECISLSSVVIPGSVTRIGQNAFYGCQKLASLTLSEGLTTIVSSAFEGCVELTSVSIPTSVTTIELRAFYGCTKLSSVTFPNSVTSVGYNVFTYCDSLKVPVYNDKLFVYLPMDYSGHYSIPEGIEQIVASACYNCIGLTAVTLPESVTTIGEGAFGNCTGLISFTLPNTVTTIDRTPFYGSSIPVPVYNDHLFAYMPESYTGAYTIPDGIEQIVGDAFANCIGLTDITIPNSVKRIGLCAFSYCTSLTKITLPNSVKAIEYYAFYSCSNLASISLGNSVELIDGHAFEDCISLESIELPNSLVTIGEQAFNGCTNLTSLEIPRNVSSIGDGFTIFCSNMTSITVASENPMFLAIDGVLFSKDTTTVLQCPPAKQGVYYLPRSVTNIKKHAFYNCAELTSLTIPNNVTNIESYAFYGCSRLSAITSEAATPPTLERFAFSNTEKATTLYVPGQSIDLYKAADQWKDFTNILPIPGTEVMEPTTVAFSVRFPAPNCPKEVELVGSFNNWTGMAMTWNSSTGYYETMCEASASDEFKFRGAGSWDQQLEWYDEQDDKWVCFNNFVIGDWWEDVAGGKLIMIDFSDSTLYGWSGTAEPTPCIIASGTCGEQGDNLTWELSCDSVLTINGTGEMRHHYSWDFHLPQDVRHIILKEGVTNISSAAFCEFRMLKTIEIPEGLTILKDSAFFMCVSLEAIEIPSSVTSMGYQVFSGCSSLTYITCKAVTPPTLGFGAFTAVDKSIPLYVPGQSIELYRVADQWKEFFNILPIPGTEVPEYPVIFLDYNSNVLSEQSVAHNEAAVAPEVPEREGYIFKGWNVDIEHIVARTFAIALYDKEGMEVTYKAEDGEVLFSEHADLHFPNVPSIDGKTFSGWLTEMADNTNGIVLRATYTVDKPTEDDDVNVVPSSTTADVNFPYVTGAITYMLVISDMSDQVVCKIMFDANGKLLGIAFAPGRNGNKQQTPQVFGFTFKVEGLNPNTTYKYEFVAHDEEDEVIETLAGSFTTTADDPQDFESVQPSEISIQKVVMNDQVLILRGEKVYTVQGQEVK